MKDAFLSKHEIHFYHACHPYSSIRIRIPFGENFGVPRFKRNQDIIRKVF